MAGMFELRKRPGLVALAVFHVPLPLYRYGLGWVFRHAFLLLEHRGRRSGRVYQTALKVLTYDPATREAIVVSAWGDHADWLRNIRAAPALKVTIARESFIPIQRFLLDAEAFQVVTGYRSRYPRKFRMLCWLLGWGRLTTSEAIRVFVSAHQFVALRPAAARVAQRQAAG